MARMEKPSGSRAPSVPASPRGLSGRGANGAAVGAESSVRVGVGGRRSATAAAKPYRGRDRSQGCESVLEDGSAGGGLCCTGLLRVHCNPICNDRCNRGWPKAQRAIA